MHAAASDSTWHANDFNPAQAGFAKTLARASGANVHLTDQAFADFCQRSDLPDFDSIGLHGIWSWISDENRSVIVDFVRRKLKVGGVLYISYNTYPGWAAFAPMRDLLLEHKKAMAAPGHGIVANIDEALTFAEKLMATNPLYAQANPTIRERLSMLTHQQKDTHFILTFPSPPASIPPSPLNPPGRTHDLPPLHARQPRRHRLVPLCFPLRAPGLSVRRRPADGQEF